jgi:hypothetical protein
MQLEYHYREVPSDKTDSIAYTDYWNIETEDCEIGSVWIEHYRNREGTPLYNFLANLWENIEVDATVEIKRCLTLDGFVKHLSYFTRIPEDKIKTELLKDNVTSENAKTKDETTEIKPSF